MKIAFCNTSCLSGEIEERFWKVTATADGDPARDCISWTNSTAVAGSEDASCAKAEKVAAQKNKNAHSHRLLAVLGINESLV
ncbi:MAG TPA: hypothetical protein VGN44_17375 [Candidatus Angelobacter sp.]